MLNVFVVRLPDLQPVSSARLDVRPPQRMCHLALHGFLGEGPPRRRVRPPLQGTQAGKCPSGVFSARLGLFFTCGSLFSVLRGAQLEKRAHRRIILVSVDDSQPVGRENGLTSCMPRKRRVNILYLNVR